MPGRSCRTPPSGRKLDLEALLDADAYINIGRDLFHRLAVHYHPLASNPIDDVPLLELMTALELAAEDLSPDSADRSPAGT